MFNKLKKILARITARKQYETKRKTAFSPAPVVENKISKPKKSKRIEKVCAFCGEKFKTTYPNKKYCTRVCLYKATLERKHTSYIKKQLTQPNAEGICAFCSKPFIKKVNPQKFCSRECKAKADVVKKRAKAGRKPQVEKPCAFCGKIFLPRESRQKYCSRKCHKTSRSKPKVEKICAFCGKKFETTYSRKRFCSVTCQENSLKKPPIEKVVSLSSPIEKICPNCEKPFQTHNENRKFCSPECRRQYFNRDRRENYVKLTCIQCGQTFQSKEGKKFCSRFCENAYTNNYEFPSSSRRPRPKPTKPLDKWISEAAQCGMSYGKYRAAIESGKTFDELKLPEPAPVDSFAAGNILFECKI